MPEITNTMQSPAPTPVPRKRRKAGLILFVLLILVVAVLALYVWITLSFNYSEGERAGYVQKFSSRGWICKTWEGELAMVNLPGTMPELFRFSVRDEAVAKTMNETLGQRVRLHYEQHKGVPTNCFGETEYFVTGVEAVVP